MWVRDNQRCTRDKICIILIMLGAKDYIAKSQPKLARFGNSEAESPWKFDFQINKKKFGNSTQEPG